jgi:hypothetical protein
MGRYMTRAQGWEKGVKCQLALSDISEDIFEQEP